MPSRFHIPHAGKVTLDKPTVTLDVRLLALRHPQAWTEGLGHLPDLEYAGFVGGTVELLRRPDTLRESPVSVPVHEFGLFVYRRLVHSASFQARPRGTTLRCTDEQATLAWVRLREFIWGGLGDRQLAESHRAAITQLFCHYVTAGKLVDAAFVTGAPELLECADATAREFAIQVLTPDAAWERLQSTYGLSVPGPEEIDAMWRTQASVLRAFGIPLDVNDGNEASGREGDRNPN